MDLGGALGPSIVGARKNIHKLSPGSRLAAVIDFAYFCIFCIFVNRFYEVF